MTDGRPEERETASDAGAPWSDPERRQLPSERGPRRGRTGVALTVALIISIVLHLLLLGGCLSLALWFIPFRAEEPAPPASESMPAFVVPTPAPSPPGPPPQTEQRSDRDTRANSPGEGPPQPHGDAILREAGAPATEPPPGRPEPEPAPEPEMHPVEPERSAETPPTAIDKRQRLAEALKGMGGTGSDWSPASPGDADSPSSGLGYAFGDNAFQIESTADVDWGPWSRKVQGIVRQNWYSVIPVAARVGMKGLVRVRFVVHRDGTLTDYELLDSAGLLPLDQAVQTALVNLSNPLPPLPLRETDEDTIRITYTFLYNLSDERELRAWQRQRWLEKKRQEGGG